MVIFITFEEHQVLTARVNDNRTDIIHTAFRLVRAVWRRLPRKADRCTVKALLDGMFFAVA